MDVEDLRRAIGPDRFDQACRQRREAEDLLGSRDGPAADVPHELSDPMWFEGTLTAAERIDLLFAVYERMPGYALLMYTTGPFEDFTAQEKERFWAGVPRAARAPRPAAGRAGGVLAVGRLLRVPVHGRGGVAGDERAGRRLGAAAGARAPRGRPGAVQAQGAALRPPDRRPPLAPADPRQPLQQHARRVREDRRRERAAAAREARAGGGDRRAHELERELESRTRPRRR